MRIIFFIVFFFVIFIPRAFSDSSIGQLHFKDESPQALGNWTGFYTGLVLGTQFGYSSDTTGAFGYNADHDKWEYNESGFNAGAALGYSYSLHGLVIGPEIELGYLRMRGSGAQPASPGSDTVGKSNSDFYTAFRARIGGNLGNNLIFATAGAIGVNYTGQVVDSCDIAPCGGSTVDASKNSFVWGYTVGAGFEHLFSKNFSIKFEYLYFNLNSQSFSGTTDIESVYNWIGRTAGNIIRGGMNYYF